MTGWRTLDGRRSAWFVTSSHAEGAGLVRGVAGRLGPDEAMPDLDVRRTGVRVTVDGSTAAELVSEVAGELGLGDRIPLRCNASRSSSRPRTRPPSHRSGRR